MSGLKSGFLEACANSDAWYERRIKALEDKLAQAEVQRDAALAEVKRLEAVVAEHEGFMDEPEEG